MNSFTEAVEVETVTKPKPRDKKISKPKLIRYIRRLYIETTLGYIL